STVDFSGSYWEIGQFQILDSKVRFAACKLDCANNALNLRGDFDWFFTGPWMAVDTEGCHKRLKLMFDRLNLNKENFNEIGTDCSAGVRDRTFGGKFLAHASTQRSTVYFDQTIRVENTFWGYRQPMSAPLIVAGDRAQLLGLENLESISYLFIHNYLSDERYAAPDVTEVRIAACRPAVIPIVNGDFYNLKTNISLPESIAVNVYQGENESDRFPEDKAHKLGCDWQGDVFRNFKVRFLLDRERNIYSKIYACEVEITAEKNKELHVEIYSDMSQKEYTNLMVEMSFDRVVNGNVANIKHYTFRQHFKRPVDCDIANVGTGEVLPGKRGNVKIAGFTIAKVFALRDQMLSDIKNHVEGISRSFEVPEVRSDIPDYTEYALSDYCGNIYDPIDGETEADYASVGTRIQQIGDDNIRVYLNDSGRGEGWKDGDQMVRGNKLYMLYERGWYLLAELECFDDVAVIGPSVEPVMSSECPAEGDIEKLME
ncbi:MAG: hypothetical protein NC082_08545, partial [Clostridiales bacterium]|nr:hypothetical protein [Clostridiales bacterium]